MEVALQWCSDAFSDTIVGFVNSIKTIDGGTHMDGAILDAAFVHTFHMPVAWVALEPVPCRLTQRSDPADPP